MLHGLNVTSAPHLLCSVLFLVSTGLFVFVVARRSFSNVSAAAHAKTGNAILVIAAVSLLAALIAPFIQSITAMDLIGSSGTGDPRVMASGFLQFIFETLFYLILTAAMLLEYAIVKTVPAKKS